MADAEARDARSATRDDVARLAGVSTAVVSYVLTGARPVGPEREARVRAAIDELGYRPNRRARALKTGRSETIGVVLTDVTNPYFAELALQIELAAAERGRAVLIVNSEERFERELALVQDLVHRGVDGVIVGSVMPGRSQAWVPNAPRPIVWIDDAHGGPDRFSVGSTLQRGTEQLVDHLVGVHGRRDVAIVLGSNPRDTEDSRVAGWRRALERAGLPLGPLVETSWTREGGAAAAADLLRREHPPDAIVACSDMLGVGVLRAAADLGADVPGRLSVVSVDGTEECEYTTPRLTTYRQPIVSMARAAVDAVLSDGPAPGRIELEGALVVQESCGCSASSSASH